MPLDVGLPKLKLSYNRAPFVLGKPLPQFGDLDGGIARPCGDVTTEEEFPLNERCSLCEVMMLDCKAVGDFA